MEQAEMQAQLEQDDYADVKDVELTWSQTVRREGRIEGRIEGLRLAISDLCEAFNIPCAAERLAALSEEDLLKLREHIKRHHSLP